MQQVVVPLFKGLAGLLAVLGLVALFVAGAMAFVAPELRTAALAVAGVGLLLLLVALMGAMETVRGVLLGRQGRYGVNTLVMILAFVGIAVLANVLVSRESYRLDLTENQSQTLAPQTVEILQRLQQEVQAIAFVVAGSPFEDGQRLLDLYSRESDRFAYRIVDPQAEPAAAINYGVQSPGTVVFLSGERQERVVTATEEEFTSALLRVTGTSQPSVAFLTGHGERDIQDTGQNGYATLRRGLEQENFLVNTLSLIGGNPIPEGTGAVVIAGPTTAPLPPEAQAISDYLQNGGKVLLLLDPETPSEWADLLGPWGVQVLPGRVFDAGNYLNPDQGTPAVLPDQYPETSPITRDLVAATFFPAAAALSTPAQAGGTATVTPLLRTSNQSWQQTSPEQTALDQAPAEQRGPLTLGVAVEVGASTSGSSEEPPRQTRVVVIGDSDFATNQFVTAYGNGDLILNSVDWLAQQEELIGIRPRPSSERPIFLSDEAQRWVLITTLLLLPILPAVVGITLRWARR